MMSKYSDEINVAKLEGALIASILLYAPSEFGSRYLAAFNRLVEEDLSNEAARNAYRRINAVLAQGLPLDMVSVAGEDMQLFGKLIGEWTDWANAIYVAAPDQAVTEIKNAALRRRMNEAAVTIAKLASDIDEEAEDQLLVAVQALERLRPEKRSLLNERLVSVMMDAYNAAGDRQKLGGGISIGLPEFDRKIGGIFPGELTLIGARPAVGKSAFATHICEAVARQGHVVQMFSLEMSREQLGMRMLAKASGMDAYRLRTGKIEGDDWEQLVQSIKAMQELPIYINTDVRTPQEIKAACLERKRSGGLGLVVVDYLQLVRAGRRIDNRTQEVGEVSRAIKLLTLELGVPVIALSQLSRQSNQRTGGTKRPQLSDLRESGALEQDADNVIFLHEPAEDELEDNWAPKAAKRDLDKLGRRYIELIVDKQRQGPVGTIPVAFDPARMRFSSISQPQEGKA